MRYLGEFSAAKTVVLDFNTHKADGTPVTLSGTPAISVYKNSTTESTSGVTLTVDYDSRTGMNHVVIDTSSDGTFYAAGNDFSIVITTGTVDSVSVVGTVVGSFSLANRAGLRPATADRTLVVDSSGLADATTVKVGPSGSGTAQTANDIGAINVTNLNTLSGHDPGATLGTGTSTLAAGAAMTLTSAYDAAKTASQAGDVMKISQGTGSNQLSFSSGILDVSLKQILGSALTESSAGYLAAAVKKFFDVASPVLTTASVNQTGNVFGSFDGITLTQIMTCLVAFINGKVTVTDNMDGTYTLSFKERNGSTEAFNLTFATSNGARSATGSIT